MSENLTPKKARARRTPSWVEPFLATLRNTANVRAACQQAHVSRVVAYELRKTDERFARRWQDAIDEAIDVLEAVGRQRALETSDTLLIFFLKSHRPQVYRETIRHELVEAEARRWAEVYGLDADEVLAEAERELRLGS